MALDITTEYANSNGHTSAYPKGSFKNETSPGLLDGTPLEAAWPNDIFGFLQKLIDEGGITISGVPDSVLASDYFNALVNIFATVTALATHAALTNPHSATAAATASRIAMRDTSGRMKAASPSADGDVAIKSYVDGLKGTFVNDGDGWPSMSQTTLTVSSVATEATWESVGPTGSGKDNIWTALDDVPTDVDWIEVSCYVAGYSTAGTPGALTEVYLAARKNGSSETLPRPYIGYAANRADDNGDETGRGINTAKIPVSSGCFDVFWENEFDINQGIVLYLTGYGYNKPT